MTENLVVNKKDWSREIQPTIDLVSILDNDASGISVEDINLARSQYCQAPQNVGFDNKVLQILCEPGAKSVQTIAQKLFGMRSVISNNNPIRKLFKIESETTAFDPEACKKVLDLINKVLLPSFLEKFLLSVKDRLQPGMSPQEKAILVYKVMQEQGYTVRQECVAGLFITDVGNYSLDCDTSSFLFAMVAHELDWPVYLVQVPQHLFSRWDDGAVKFNIDYGEIIKDNYYREVYGTSDVDGRKFKFSDAEFLFYLNRGANRMDMSTKPYMLKYALEDFDMVEKLKPPFEIAEIYSNRGMVKIMLGQFDNSMKDLYQALEIDPSNSTAFSGIGVIMTEQGKYEEAIKYFDAAISINPKYPEALYNKGRCYEKQGKNDDAAIFYKKVLIANPNYQPARAALDHLKK